MVFMQIPIQTLKAVSNLVQSFLAPASIFDSSNKGAQAKSTKLYKYSEN